MGWANAVTSSNSSLMQPLYVNYGIILSRSRACHCVGTLGTHCLHVGLHSSFSSSSKLFSTWTFSVWACLYLENVPVSWWFLPYQPSCSWQFARLAAGWGQSTVGWPGQFAKLAGWGQSAIIVHTLQQLTEPDDVVLDNILSYLWLPCVVSETLKL